MEIVVGRLKVGDGEGGSRLLPSFVNLINISEWPLRGLRNLDVGIISPTLITIATSLIIKRM